MSKSKRKAKKNKTSKWLSKNKTLLPTNLTAIFKSNQAILDSKTLERTLFEFNDIFSQVLDESWSLLEELDAMAKSLTFDLDDNEQDADKREQANEEDSEIQLLDPALEDLVCKKIVKDMVNVKYVRRYVQYLTSLTILFPLPGITALVKSICEECTNYNKNTPLNRIEFQIQLLHHVLYKRLLKPFYDGIYYPIINSLEFVTLEGFYNKLTQELNKDEDKKGLMRETLMKLMRLEYIVSSTNCDDIQELEEVVFGNGDI